MKIAILLMLCSGNLLAIGEMQTKNVSQINSESEKLNKTIKDITQRHKNEQAQLVQEIKVNLDALSENHQLSLNEADDLDAMLKEIKNILNIRKENNKKMNELYTKFNKLTSEQEKELEAIQARLAISSR